MLRDIQLLTECRRALEGLTQRVGCPSASYRQFYVWNIVSDSTIMAALAWSIELVHHYRLVTISDKTKTNQHRNRNQKEKGKDP